MVLKALRILADGFLLLRSVGIVLLVCRVSLYWLGGRQTDRQADRQTDRQTRKLVQWSSCKVLLQS